MAKWVRLAERVLLSLLVVFGGLAMFYGLYLLVFLGSIFSIHEVTVEGRMAHLTTQKVIELSGVKPGQNLFGIDVSSIHRNLKGHPWVNRVAVRRRLPHTLWIYVEEFTAAAVIQKKDALSFIDQEGVVFKPVEPMDPKAFPIITGIDVYDENKAASHIQDVLAIIASFRETAFGQAQGIAELHWDKARGFEIITEKGPTQIVLGNDAIASRLDLLDRWQSVMNRRGGHIKYILANDGKRITVGYN